MCRACMGAVCSGLPTRPKIMVMLVLQDGVKPQNTHTHR